MRRLLAVALTALPLMAQAWGPDGHQTVATIAAALIKGTPAEARMKLLLGDISLSLASVWADCVKGISPSQDFTYPSPGKYAECAPLETPDGIAEMADYVRRNDRQCHIGLDEDGCHRQTHYADIALQRSRYVLGFAGTRRDDVVGALRTAIGVLQGKAPPGPPHFKSPREALLVLVHLVGDIHQPLHIGAVYLDDLGRRVDPEKTGFRPGTFTSGGNSLWLIDARPPTRARPPAGAGPGAPVTAGFGPVKLHTIWDGVPDKLKPRHVDAAWLAEARKIHPNQGDPVDWPARWATQSLEQARAAFDGLKFSARQDTHWNVRLPPGYNARADAIKRQQLTIAGARLAQVLKATLAP
jgi:hypothetical protein